MKFKNMITISVVAALLIVGLVPSVSPAGAVTCKSINDRTWKLIYKTPKKYKGQNFTVWGNIFQFDDATGPSTFLGYVAGTNKFDGTWWSNYDNAMLQSTSKRLSNFVEGDVFKACVTIKGSYTYERAAGGTNTVPLLYVNSIRYVGSTD